MKLFPCAHATHPDAHMAAALVLAQLRAQMARPEYASAPTLGLLYITDRCAGQAPDLLALLRTELPQVRDWVGATGIGVCASGAEYWDEPALAVMLCDLAPSQYRVFSGLSPLPPDWGAHSALVHADPHTPELAELLGELASRTRSKQLFGGLVASRQQAVQFAQSGHTGDAQGAFTGGLSGVAWADGVPLLTRLTQGCQPVGPAHQLGRVDALVALELDGEPALDVLQRDLDISLAAPQRAVQVVRQTLVGLSRPGHQAIGRAGELQADVRVRHIIGLDPMRQGVALAEPLQTGMQLVFCRRDPPSARADLMRICAELREALEPESLPLEDAVRTSEAAVLGQPLASKRILGAVYVSCTGRGGGHFGGPGAEMQIIRHALGEVPLVGFYAAGEIAGQQLYGYTGVLTVFTGEEDAAVRPPGRDRS